MSWFFKHYLIVGLTKMLMNLVLVLEKYGRCDSIDHFFFFFFIMILWNYSFYTPWREYALKYYYLIAESYIFPLIICFKKTRNTSQHRPQFWVGPWMREYNCISTFGGRGISLILCFLYSWLGEILFGVAVTIWQKKKNLIS